MAIQIQESGVLSLLQDRGRFGRHDIGLTTGGPLDLNAYRICNKLLGNSENSTVIETTLGGLSITALADHVICVTGAPVSMTVNDQSLPLWTCHKIKLGDRVSIRAGESGLRNYLGIAGGFNVKKTFGSTSTVLREGIGGTNGGKLASGDILDCLSGDQQPLMRLSVEQYPSYPSQLSLRVVKGYQIDSFPEIDIVRFFSNRFQISDQCDRMGYRLSGPSITSNCHALSSEGISLGAIQIPTDGQPIVLLNDRQTIGGYPKLGSVISLDIAKLSQLRPGDWVDFKPISIETAHNLLHLNEYFIQTLHMTETTR